MCYNTEYDPEQERLNAAKVGITRTYNHTPNKYTNGEFENLSQILDLECGCNRSEAILTLPNGTQLYITTSEWAQVYILPKEKE